MRSRYGFREPGAAHFITGTVVSWLPVFTTAARCDVLIETMRFSREKKALKVYAWVVLDNHFHVIVDGPNLAEVVGELKRFTAKRMIELLEQERCDWLLHLLAFERAKHKRASTYQFWQEGSHPQAIADEAMMQQKLDYIHSNPVKRGLVAGPEHWRYSSAHERLVGAMPVMVCDRWR